MDNDDTTQRPRTIRSEEHGHHWVAWIAGADDKPEQSVVLVGQSREEAEEKAKRWRDGQTRSSA